MLASNIMGFQTRLHSRTGTAIPTKKTETWLKWLFFAKQWFAPTNCEYSVNMIFDLPDRILASEPDCSGGPWPPTVAPLFPGLALINALDFVQLIGQGALCRTLDII
jgi:hypothetical protein